MNIKILFENKNLVVIEKPSGLVVHSDGKTEEPTVADWVLENYPEVNGVGENMHIEHKGQKIELNRPGIVHRIDRDTSGCLIVAKTQESFDHLKNLFQTKGIQKTYIALVYGEMKNEEGIIDVPIGRHAKDFRMKMAGENARGQVREAQTKYRVLADYVDERKKNNQGQYEKYTLVECSPLTGRTHQIRVHLKYINHPIVADTLYKGKRKECLGLERTALHAESIQFVDCAGNKISVKSELAQDIRKAFEALSLAETEL
jgi:23S rRNA pseudouridine1911/1915/1917 synthase